MSNYLVDASVYAFPKHIYDESNTETIELFEEYLENLNKLFELMEVSRGASTNSLKVNYFMFCENDIRTLIKNCLFLDEDNENLKKKLKSMRLNRKHEIRLKNLERYMLEHILPLQNGVHRLGKYCTFETLIGIEDIELNGNFQCTPNISTGHLDAILIQGLKENIGRLAFLNHKIYKSNSITSIITNNCEEKYNVSVIIKNVRHNFLDVECQNIYVSDCSIVNYNIKTPRKKYFSSIDEALKKAKNDFQDTIDYDINKMYPYVDEYEEALDKLRYRQYANVDEIKNHIEEYPIVVYDCLGALDKLVKFNRQNNERNQLQAISKKINCRSIGEHEVCDKCRGYLILCGFDCSTEDKIRTFGDKSYQIHLKPYKKMEKTKNAEKNLRIYFRWDRDADKIEIGYIGKHLN